MVNIHKVKVKNDISFGNSEENNKSGNTNTALGVGLGAGLVGYLGGRKFFTTEPSADQVLAKPDEFIPSNLSAEEQKAADTIKNASKEMSELDKKAEEEVAKKFKKKNEITIKVSEKKIEKLEKQVAKHKEAVDNYAKDLEHLQKALPERAARVGETKNPFKKLGRWFKKKMTKDYIPILENNLNFSENNLYKAEKKLGFNKLAKDGKVTKDAYKTFISDAIKNRIVNKAEEALKVLKGKLTKVGSPTKAIIAAAVSAIVGFFAAKTLTKPKETPIPEKTEEIEVAKKPEEGTEIPEEVEVVEVSEETQETEESEEKAA